MSLERKLRRANANKKKKAIEKAMAEKVALFGQLPTRCLACEKDFDKTDRKQVMTWNVVVRKEKGEVNLYCPSCWNKALEVIEGLKERFEKKKEEACGISPSKK